MTEGIHRRDEFTKRRFLWLDQVSANPDVSSAGFRLAYAISRYINRGTGQAWPTQGTLAKDTRMSRRGVQLCINSLAKHGHLFVVAGKGRGLRSTYEMIIHTPDDEEKANYGSPYEEKKGERQCAFSGVEKANETHEKANGATKKGERPFAQNSLKEPFDELFEIESISPALKSTPPVGSKSSLPSKEKSSFDEAFESLWRAFPKRIARPAARRAWDAAIRHGADPQHIIAGALRYAAERTGQDPKFTKHPATWLNNECWLDEAAPAPTPAPAHRPAAANVWDAFQLSDYRDDP